MAAESIKPHPITKATRKPTPKQINIIKTKQEHPDLNSYQVAKLCDTDHSHVIKTLQRYEIDKQNVIHYKNNRADILADLQHKLLSSITIDEIKKAPLGTRILGMAQLYDKERLERGMSSENIQLIHADIAKIKGQVKQEW